MTLGTGGSRDRAATWFDHTCAVIGRHPIISATLILCTVAGAVAGFVYLDAEWSALRRITAGAVAGGGTGLLFTATKMIG